VRSRDEAGDLVELRRGRAAPVGHLPLALGDFNHDGSRDVGVINGGTLELGILLGNGDGTFRQPKS